jgi:hypothetical protein
MKKLIYSMWEFTEQGGTPKQYYNQFDTVKTLEVGKRYVIMPNDWQQSIVEIFYIGNGIAVGVEVDSCATKAGSKGRKIMFSAEGLAYGWVYGENRAQYRLQELDRIKKK